MTLRWYQKPIALLGSISVAYHEVLRGRDTGICTDCGRLNHATADKCLCGGDVEENEHASETLEDPTAGTEDTFDRPIYRFAIPALKIIAITGSIFLLKYAIEHGNLLAGFVALLVATFVTSTGA